jgi:hypothetical protein
MRFRRRAPYEGDDREHWDASPEDEARLFQLKKWAIEGEVDQVRAPSGADAGSTRWPSNSARARGARPPLPAPDAARPPRAQVRAHLRAGSGEVDIWCPDGWTQLRHAAELGHVDVVRLLCEAGADTEPRNVVRPARPAHAAGSGGGGGHFLCASGCGSGPLLRSGAHVCVASPCPASTCARRSTLPRGEASRT